MPSPGCDVAFTYVEWISPVIITCEHISAHAEAAAAAMAHDRSPNICDFCGMHQCFQNKAYVNDILPYISLITVSSMSATFRLQTSSNKIFYQPDTRVTSSSLRTSATPSRSVYDLMQRCRSLMESIFLRPPIHSTKACQT